MNSRINDGNDSVKSSIKEERKCVRIIPLFDHFFDTFLSKRINTKKIGQFLTFKYKNIRCGPAMMSLQEAPRKSPGSHQDLEKLPKRLEFLAKSAAVVVGSPKEASIVFYVVTEVLGSPQEAPIVLYIVIEQKPWGLLAETSLLVHTLHVKFRYIF